MNQQADRSDTFEKLRQDVRKLEGFKRTGRPQNLLLGGGISEYLPACALSFGAIHEFISTGYEGAAATIAFTLALLTNLPRQGTLVWIARDHVQYAPGFALFGIDPQRIIFARPQKDADTLWVMEEALRCKGLAAVAGECAMADLTASRRLQLAAEESGVMGLLLRPFSRQTGTSSCMTRWQVKHAPSLPKGLPGLGEPRWQVELLKARGGKPGSWMMEWHNNGLSLVTAPQIETCMPEKNAGAIVPFALRA